MVRCPVDVVEALQTLEIAFCEGKYMLDESPDIDPATAINVMSSRFCNFGNTLYSSVSSSAFLPLDLVSMLELSEEFR